MVCPAKLKASHSSGAGSATLSWSKVRRLKTLGEPAVGCLLQIVETWWCTKPVPVEVYLVLC